MSKNSFNLDNMLSQINEKINSAKMTGESSEDSAVDIDLSGTYIPNILDFCYSPQYLNLLDPLNPIRLYPVQELILKCFYTGSWGNEDLLFTKDDYLLCQNIGLTSDEVGNFVAKIKNKQKTEEDFRELVLVLGRRSGKDFLVAIIALYEAMKLLEIPGGNPYKRYGLSPDAPISILTIANSKSQAGIAFNEIKGKFMRSKYFSDKYVSDGIGSRSIYLLTKHDKKEISDAAAIGKNYTKKGSICIEVGHSNTDSLVGKGVFVLILDEVAMYKNTQGSSSGDRILSAMTPTLSTYGVWVDTVDENGNEKKIRRYESKLIAISSPRGKEGILWRLFSTASSAIDRLACRLPSWVVNPNLTEGSLREANKSIMSEEQFMMEYGADFSGSVGSAYFNSDKVRLMFKNNLEFTDAGKPGQVYFIHIDPASTSHNYALVILHRQTFIDNVGKSDWKIVIDHIKYWHPTADKPIFPRIADEYLVGLKKRFKIGLVTYDQWNNLESIDRIKKASIPHKCTRFVRSYKMKIYSELYHLLSEERIICPYHPLLMDEMLNLQYRTTENGFKIFPKRDENGVFTDDICDCVAGAIFSVINHKVKGYPSAKLADTGTEMSNSHNMTWNGMQGPIGTGSGQRVVSEYSKIMSFPQDKIW